MSLDYIREYYRVPAKQGMQVIVDGTPGVIVGACGAYLRVRFVGSKRSVNCHPTWRVQYIEPDDSFAKRDPWMVDCVKCSRRLPLRKDLKVPFHYVGPRDARRQCAGSGEDPKRPRKVI